MICKLSVGEKINMEKNDFGNGKFPSDESYLKKEIFTVKHGEKQNIKEMMRRAKTREKTVIKAAEG